jgi:hypothetical protein
MYDIIENRPDHEAPSTTLKKLAPYAHTFKNLRVEQMIQDGKSEKDAKKAAKKESEDLIGLGIKKDNRTRKEQVVPFGAVQLNIDKLKAGYLKLTYNNGNAVKEIKLTQISDTMKSLIMDILHQKKFSDFKFKKLSDDEKHVYKLMIKKVRLAGEVDVRLDQLGTPTIDKLKNEWTKVFGEINAGNDSPQLIKRAKELIQIFIEKKLITRTEGLNLLMRL